MLGLLLLAIAIVEICAVVGMVRTLAGLEHSPMSLPVDFSSTGVYTADYRQYAVPPFGMVELLIEIPGATEALAEERFAGLVFDVTIRSATGAVVYRSRFDERSAEASRITMFVQGIDQRSVNTLRLHGVDFAKGDYRFDLSVAEPAPALAALRTDLRAEYLVSVYPFAVGVHAIVAGAAVVLAAIAWFARALLRDRQRRASTCRSSAASPTSVSTPSAATVPTAATPA
ncbi:MAG: hypothetical protein H6816_11750 [Phycisphaerales bacterium]|nr:hypothetical protein [Phycisphaerales bacterium]